MTDETPEKKPCLNHCYHPVEALRGFHGCCRCAALRSLPAGVEFGEKMHALHPTQHESRALAQVLYALSKDWTPEERNAAKEGYVVGLEIAKLAIDNADLAQGQLDVSRFGPKLAARMRVRAFAKAAKGLLDLHKRDAASLA